MAKVSYFPTLGRPDEADFDRLAEVAQQLADEIDADEARIKDAILSALQNGDVNRAVEIVRHWQAAPPCEVVAALGGN